MEKLPTNSLIMFGTTYKQLNKFYIDTVFVVKSFEPSVEVIENDGANYSKVYREATLDYFPCYTGKPSVKSDSNIYHSLTWWDNKEFFSFVPCKTDMENDGFEKLFLYLDDTKLCEQSEHYSKTPPLHLSPNHTGRSYLLNCTLSSFELWKVLVKEAEAQGFKLGVRLDEPKELMFSQI